MFDLYNPGSIKVPPLSRESNTTLFQTNATALFGLKSWLPYLLNGYATLLAKDPVYYKPQAVEAAWKGSWKLDLWIKNLATSMTNVIRTDIPSSRAEFNGTAYRLTYVVRWTWVILPAILVISSFGLWVVIMIKTSRSMVQAWEGGSLPLLVFDVDKEIKWLAESEVDKRNGLEGVLKKRQVVLVKQPSGIRKFEAVSAISVGEGEEKNGSR
jgi:hypothetical protein